MGLIILMVFIIPSLYSIGTTEKIKELKEIGSLLILLILPFIFVIKTYLDETYYIPYFFICYGVLYITMKLKKNQSLTMKALVQTILLVLFFSLVIILYDQFTRLDDFYFFYYQNPKLQWILIAAYSVLNIYFFLMMNKQHQLKRFINKKCCLV